MKLNAGVIGVGNMGQHHARNYFESGLANLVAVSDQNPKIGQTISKRFSAHYYPDYLLMLEKEKLDLVTIAVPTKSHKKVALDCIARKINILIEKPIAGSIAEAKEIVAKAREKGIKFTVGHIERFNPAVLKLKEMIDRGKLGQITTIVTRRMGPMPPQVKDANVVIDIGVHDIDLLNWFYGGLPTHILAAGGNALNQFKQDYASFFLKYGNASGMALTNWITPIKLRRMAVSGTKAYAEVNFITQELDLYEVNCFSEYDDFGEYVIKFGEPKEKKQIKVSNIEPLKAEIESFIKAIKTDSRPVVTAREAIDALDVACKIDRMIRG